MYKDPRLWTAVVIMAGAAWLIGNALMPARPPAVAKEAIPVVQYVCRKSGEVFSLPLTGDVLNHPTTGQPTLVPAVFDKKSKKWKPGPPLDVMHRKGLLRPAS